MIEYRWTNQNLIDSYVWFVNDCRIRLSSPTSFFRPQTLLSLLFLSISSPSSLLPQTEIHDTIVAGRLFQRGDRVAIGASGGKDSTVLAHIMKTLNERYDYGLELFLLSVDEGITGYRDDSLETVKRNQLQYDLPLKIVSYEGILAGNPSFR